MIKEFFSENVLIGKNKFYYIYIDSILFTSIKEVTYKQLGLFKTYKLDLDNLKEILERTEVNEAKIKALTLLARSSHFENDLRRKLKDRGYVGYVQDRAIEEIKKLKYLDDYQTAENLVFSFKNKSKRFIENKLREKKVEEQLILKLLENFEENDIYLENQILKYIMNLDLDNFKDFQKALNYFIRKGYDYKKVKTILNKIKEKNYG